ncbi:hypothetical protein PC2016_0517 [Pseudoalteromonas carrageenovora]|uniref:Uncharacterized protein n=1 Tax=Pseudoalteromonas carrageenovora IAM 12662 TaxID=1314868 RepID=A0A2K4X680_PSEVC|nr:hypothetical protein [Pseudoalteromonas carrageenovora]MBE0382027.1 hypothetical protein [Pseudoalteromonas carrageenovora IAM 12662]MDO6546524.1 hypothetical protein [Pseudoalteromonas carrageenovora]MDO6830495.1 hypothetical protein [Pseudoalteromonas carrageenovora]QBJ70761.1 hypothetical protein PC2016_0517 [Pseudoalteromonas carrageenovora]SOU39826.1 conserved membrane protein of unknown function [Pseudoalteromonas carrageenovora IAM 12662]
MKAIAICVLIYLLLFTDFIAFIHVDSWQLPLWIADISWAGLELVGALAAIVAVVAVVALVTMGLVGAGVVALVGTVLALLFGSLMIAWPLLFVAVLCWLVADNKKVAS